jgi:signal transduction histidine kinase
MSGHRLSLWTLITAVVVVVLSVGAWGLVRNGVGRQNEALVRTGAAQVALVLQTSVQDIAGELRSLAFFTSSAGYSPTVFDQQAKAIRTNPKTSVVLADVSPPAPKVLLTQGPDLPGRQGADPLLAAAIRGGAALAATIVNIGPATDLVMSTRSTTAPNLVAFSATPINPSAATTNTRGPYRNFYINLYNGTKPASANLIVSTYGPRPLPAPVGQSVVRFGHVVWLIEASPKSPPAGAVANASPWFTLGIGLLLALALATLVEVLTRHTRVSANLAQERTADLVAAQHTIVRQERLSAVGEMAAVVGHELRNPLAAALNYLFVGRLALGDEMPAAVDENLTAAELQIQRAARLCQELTAYTREYVAKIESIEFSALVAQVLETTPAPEGVTVTVDGAMTFDADPVLMAQVLTNVITNAYQAMPEGGGLRLAARGDPVGCITVEDDGVGIDPQSASRLFDPFVTTKAKGTGLGLAIVQRLVEAQGGTVCIENRDTGGAKVTISLLAGSAIERHQAPADSLTRKL